jgi:hypothetical protein
LINEISTNGHSHAFLTFPAQSKQLFTLYLASFKNNIDTATKTGALCLEDTAKMSTPDHWEGNPCHNTFGICVKTEKLVLNAKKCAMSYCVEK